MSKGITAITVFKATQESKVYAATSVTYQTLFSPAIFIDDIQMNFSTSFECRIADLEAEQLVLGSLDRTRYRVARQDV